MAKISDLTQYTPFENYGITKDDYVGLGDLIGHDIEIVDAEGFTNRDDEPGVYVLFRNAGEGQNHYFTTHAAGIMGKLLDNDDVQAVLKSDDVIECRVVQRKSKTSNNQVITIE